MKISKLKKATQGTAKWVCIERKALLKLVNRCDKLEKQRRPKK